MFTVHKNISKRVIKENSLDYSNVLLLKYISIGRQCAPLFSLITQHLFPLFSTDMFFLSCVYYLKIFIGTGYTKIVILNFLVFFRLV